jgi:hypothetical protein
MTVTYEAIQSYTGTGSSKTVTFSVIPGTYTDLVLVTQFQATASGDFISFRINGDTGSKYSFTQVYGTGSGSGASARSANQTTVTWESVPASPEVGNTILHFQNYSNTTTNKTVLFRSNLTSSVVRGLVALWRSTAAITSIELYNNGNNFTTASTFTLYGIKAE